MINVNGLLEKNNKTNQAKTETLKTLEEKWKGSVEDEMMDEVGDLNQYGYEL